MKQFFLRLLLLLSIQTTFAQFSWNAEANLKAMAGTENELPFWMVHNQRGRILEDSNFAGWITGRSQYAFNNNSVLEVGVGLLGREGSGGNFFVDELYAHYETKFWSFTVGRKQQEEFYNGLSASNRSILWSLNARPLYGLQLETTKPIFLLKNFGFEATWEEYLMDDDRFVDNTRLHHKSFHLVYSTTNRDLLLKAGIQHFAQWGGNSPEYGNQPKRLRDYLRIFTGHGGSESAAVGDQQNALGNHIGGYELLISKKFKNLTLNLLYNHLFEDGSGGRFGNTPDGRYGLFINLHKNKLINGLMYEFFYTRHQSKTTSGVHKYDHYFTNYIYQSGWTYYDKILGAPFFTVDSDGLGLLNNTFFAHHLALEGNYKYPYKLSLSFAHNEGINPNLFESHQNVFYILYDLRLLDKDIKLNLQLSAEYDSYKSPIYGTGLKLVYLIKNREE